MLDTSKTYLGLSRFPDAARANEGQGARWQRELRIANGSLFVTRKETHDILFATGARMFDENNMGYEGPPSDDLKRTTLIREFYQRWIDELQIQFDECKFNMAQAVKAGNQAHPDLQALLKAIQAEAAVAKGHWETANAEWLKHAPYELTPEGQAEALRRKTEREQAEVIRRDNARAEIQKMELFPAT